MIQEGMVIFSLIPVPFLQDPVGHLEHELHVLVAHLPGPVEQQAQARILVESLQPFLIL